jgi:hypothetical protein
MCDRHHIPKEPSPELRATPPAPNDYSTQSAHFGTSAFVPHGMIGTLEVEFFGEPSMMRSL